MAHDLPDEYFFTSHVTHNRRQNEAIHALDAQLSVTRDRLNSEMRRISGSLEQRLDRLSTSFDAFVELSDLRALLAVFTEPAAVRYRTHRVLEGAADDDGGRDDVAGYWLCPAARGLSAAVRGDTSGARSHMAAAAAVDALRAGTFALLGTAAAAPDEAPLMADWILAKILPELPDEVTRYQRALWIAAGDGLLGDDAYAAVQQAAADAVRRADADGDPAARPEFWISAAPAPAPPARSRVLSGCEGARRQVEAAARLASLRAWLEEALMPQEDAAEEAGAADSAAADGRGGAAGGQGGLDEEAAETLRLLIDEGTAEEAPHLARATQLRAVIESSGTASADNPVPAWTDPAGSTAELVRADAVSRLCSPGRRALAIGVYSPVIAQAAEDLAGRAAEQVDAEAEVVYHGKRVRVTAGGVDEASLRAAREAVEASYAPDRTRLAWAGAAGGAAVLLAVLALAAQTAGLWLAVVAALAVAGVVVYRDRQDRARNRAAVESAGRRLRDKAEEGAAECRELHRQADTAAQQASDDLPAVRKLLRGA
ncbi:hypothetical protein FZ103_02080 [Streptomonospora sp. PA3]|uniref:hypothetical protein n=1 Tax=Streptomonospora sp. PA3 TaxID=2607326 RepID=UPI0012DFD040|nr:hypothetical protein [Streptomonospora sp. PA3]MUL39976.1 hypothetical protein [Streptomonospora sp. PA3]